jgi:uncharacterized protein
VVFRGAFAFLATLAIATAAGAGGDRPAAKSAFWLEREADYRTSARGPFTAIHAAYLGYRGEENLYVVDGELVPEPTGRGDALRINFARPGFLIGPVEAKGFDPAVMFDPSIGKDRYVYDSWFVGPEAGDSLNVRVGRFLVSLDMQDEKTGRVLVHDPDLLAGRFHGFDVFPESGRYRVMATVRDGDGEEVDLGTSRGLSKRFVRAAVLAFRIGRKECTLTGFRSADDDADGPLFVPFRDATSGDETYGVGRYLRVEPEGDQAVVDFNHATNPWCAYSPWYNCVLPPPGNELPVEIRAGEKTPPGH